MFVSKLASVVCSPLVAMFSCLAEYFAESRALHQNTGSFGVAASQFGTFGGCLWSKCDEKQRTGEHEPRSHMPCAGDETSQQTRLQFIVSTAISHLISSPGSILNQTENTSGYTDAIAMYH